jgi:hypothetical protein
VLWNNHIKILKIARCLLLRPEVLATQEAEIGGLPQLEASLGKEFVKPHLEKTHHKKGLVEWLKL